MIGCIDLSIGGILSMTGVIMATLLRMNMHAGLAILIGIVAGTLFGVVNGILITKLRMPSFITTFAMMGVAQSIANVLSERRTVYWESSPKNNLISILGDNILRIEFGNRASQVLTISYLVLITVVVVTIVIILFNRTSLKSRVFSIGENEEIARLSGIRTHIWKIGIFATSGFLSAIAAMLVLIRTNSLQPTTGEGLEFQAVVAAVLGGNTLRGGKGSLFGTILGALALYSVRSSLSLAGIDTSVVMIVIGGVLILGMWLNETIHMYEEKVIDFVKKLLIRRGYGQ
jgi:ribose/xylose/arabinose/galactoside ABC-type transport system permease subunit